MASIIPGYEYDIFISYRQKDNKHDGWVTEFVDNLKGELESTFKEEISVYFDINPHDGLLETHDVDESLKEKLKCLVFIPIISRTYCDPKSFAWEHEFKAFVEQASQDHLGLKVKLPNGNVASRVLPVRIHDLDAADIKECESVLGGVLRGIEFIYKSAGVNRPLRSTEEKPHENLNKTIYRDQINKVALAIKDIITAIEHPGQKTEGILKEIVNVKPEKAKKLIPKTIVASVIVLALIVIGYFLIPTFTKPKEQIEKSIAVLPFINDSPSDSNQYFINGFMEDVLNHLQTIRDLHPISRTSAEKYRKTTKSIPEIAKELSVNYIVEGDMQRYGNSIRLSVNLFKAFKKELKLWGKTYEKKINDATDIFSLQSQIAQSIATELEAVITPQEKLLIEKSQTSSLSAYENCIMGTNYFNKNTKEDIDIALHYFEKAKEIDPDYADAYLDIAHVWIWRAGNSFATPEEATPIAKSNVAKAFKLDSTSSEVYAFLSAIQIYFDWNFNSAEESSEKSISLNPNNGDAHWLYSILLTVLGHPKEALEQHEMALKLDPMNNALKTSYGSTLICAGRYNEAIKVFQEVLKIDPGNAEALDNLPLALHEVRRYSEELEAWKVDYYTCYKGYANVFDQGYAKGGLIGALNLQADSLVKKSKTKFIEPCEIAQLYACAGNKERTLEMLEKDYEVHDPSFPVVLRMPIYEFVHDEPRYQNLFHKINLPYKP
jgi:TolB-like protein/cytochrome c-type biogenesis protein CcmH/NrfG